MAHMINLHSLSKVPMDCMNADLLSNDVNYEQLFFATTNDYFAVLVGEGYPCQT
jgi:hypothetical protein